MFVAVLIVYIIICILMYFLQRLFDRPLKIYVNIFVVLSYFFIIGFSDFPDKEAYLEYFNYCNGIRIDLNFNFEKGFQFITQCIKFVIGDSPVVYYCIIALLEFWLVYAASKKFFNHIYPDTREWADKFIVFFIFYISYFGLYYSGIAIRQGLALSIIIYLTASILTESKNVALYIKSCLLLIIAFLFHSSAFLGIVVLGVLLLPRVSRAFYITFCLFCMILYLSNVGAYIGDLIFDRKLTGIVAQYENDSFAKINHYIVDNGLGVDMLSSKSFWFIYLLFLGGILGGMKHVPQLYYKYLNIYMFGIMLGTLWFSIDGFSRIMDYFIYPIFILAFIFWNSVRNINLRLIFLLYVVFPQLIYLMRVVLTT